MLEGGGQILRNAASLSAITGTAITIDNIRAKRTKPGLRPQHLTGLQMVSSLSEGSTLLGASVGSTEVTFSPGQRLHGGSLVADTGTAGSCMLLIQIALPCLLFTDQQYLQNQEKTAENNEIRLKGGTDAAMAPPIEYLQRVLLPTLRQHLHIDVSLHLVRRGFFPRGQGLVNLKVKSLQAESSLLPAFHITSRGDIEEILMSVFTAGKVNVSVGERMIATAEKIVESRIAETTATDSPLIKKNIKINRICVREPPEQAFGDGCGIILVAKSSTGCLLGATGLGERGVPAEDVAQGAADELMDLINSKTCVDDHLIDQLIIFMALAGGRSEVIAREPTLHTRTAVAVAEILTPAKFEIRELKEENGGLWSISCQGAGISAVGIAVNDTG